MPLMACVSVRQNNRHILLVINKSTSAQVREERRQEDQIADTQKTSIAPRMESRLWSGRSVCS